MNARQHIISQPDLVGRGREDWGKDWTGLDRGEGAYSVYRHCAKDCAGYGGAVLRILDGTHH